MISRIRRPIVEIDEAKCDGCGQCVPACAEGAIRVIDGKAKLVADVYCDGLGACLGHCPRGAIKIIHRDADAFDESVQHASVDIPVKPSVPVCPGAAMHDLRLPVLPASPAAASRSLPESGVVPLCHWPVQLHLVPTDAPFLRGADVCLVADCVPFACADFHARILRGRPVIIGCPKLDDSRAYVDKLADMLGQSAIKSLTVVHMEVPCCTNLLRIAVEASQRSGCQVPLTEVTVSRRGEILPTTE